MRSEEEILSKLKEKTEKLKQIENVDLPAAESRVVQGEVFADYYVVEGQNIAKLLKNEIFLLRWVLGRY